MRLVSFRLTDQASNPVAKMQRTSLGDERLFGIRTGVLIDSSQDRLEFGREVTWPSDGIEVVDLTTTPFELSNNWSELLEDRDSVFKTIRHLVSKDCVRYRPEDVELCSPIPWPSKFYGIGLNYLDHIEEMGVEKPAYQVWFTKARTCINGPYDPIVIPSVSSQVDYEGELGLVIGKRCKDVLASEALGALAGYVVVNDVSVRDWQKRTSQFTIGKGFDSHGPVGPWIVTPDEVPDPQALEITTRVNSEVRQSSSTSKMVFTCVEMIVELSQAMTLEPGDIIATGTPAGVGASFQPAKWLVDGDKVEIEITGVGKIANPVRKK